MEEDRKDQEPRFTVKSVAQASEQDGARCRYSSEVALSWESSNCLKVQGACTLRDGVGRKADGPHNSLGTQARQGTTQRLQRTGKNCKHEQEPTAQTADGMLQSHKTLRRCKPEHMGGWHFCATCCCLGHSLACQQHLENTGERALSMETLQCQNTKLIKSNWTCLFLQSKD